MLLPSMFNDSFADDMFNEMFSFPFETTRRMWNHTPMMNTDVQEYENGYEVDLELPGFKKEDVHAELQNGYLTICAKHSENKDEKDQDGRYIRRERYSGQCQRSFYVGNQVTQDDIKASFENGVLRLNIPKKEEPKDLEQGRYIAIE